MRYFEKCFHVFILSAMIGFFTSAAQADLFKSNLGISNWSGDTTLKGFSNRDMEKFTNYNKKEMRAYEKENNIKEQPKLAKEDVDEKNKKKTDPKKKEVKTKSKETKKTKTPASKPKKAKKYKMQKQTSNQQHNHSQHDTQFITKTTSLQQHPQQKQKLEK